MLDSAVSFVSIATGGLTRGKTLHEADFAAWHYNYSITINLYHFADVSKMIEYTYTFCGT